MAIRPNPLEPASLQRPHIRGSYLTTRDADQYDLDVARARLYSVLEELESDVWVIDVALK
jgi:hypothetical protein